MVLARNPIIAAFAGVLCFSILVSVAQGFPAQAQAISGQGQWPGGELQQYAGQNSYTQDAENTKTTHQGTPSADQNGYSGQNNSQQTDQFQNGNVDYSNSVKENRVPPPIASDQGQSDGDHAVEPDPAFVNKDPYQGGPNQAYANYVSSRPGAIGGGTGGGSLKYGGMSLIYVPAGQGSGGGGAGGSSGGCSAAGYYSSCAGAAGTCGAVGAANSQNAQSPSSKCGGSKSDGGERQASRASSAGEDALQNLMFAMEDYVQYMINVGNEDAGSACSSEQPSKTYANVVWMVERMYHSTYLPLAILFLLPGAVLTQAKTMVSFGFLSTKDDDTTTPLAGIFRSIIAIFLIPATQLCVSYMIDVGNASESCVSQYVSMPLIMLWVEEQVVIFTPNQQGNPIRNLPNMPFAPWRGKFAGMPIAGAMLEQVSGLDGALAEMCNETFHMLTLAMTVMSAFQIATLCYLFLVGPLVAAFFAWPGVGRELFRRAFSVWLDAVVIVSLWKFWWNIVLACWTLWLQNGAINPFDPWGPYWMAAWMCILVTVPFNPFEFKPGEIVTHVLQKAEAVAAKVAQGGKGGGSGGNAAARPGAGC